MKHSGWAVAALVLASVLVAYAQEAAAPAAQGVQTNPPPTTGGAQTDAAAEGLGLTQGQFALQVIHEVRAERFFEGAVTAEAASGKLAGMGLSPEGGWSVRKELTRSDLVTAYVRLLSVVEPEPADAAPPAGEAAAGAATGQVAVAEAEAAAAAKTVGEMTIAELMEKISDAVRKALARVTSERQPISPTRPLWR